MWNGARVYQFAMAANSLRSWLFDQCDTEPDYLLYCSSDTCSIQSTALAVERLRNGDVGHRGRRRCAMPMLLARRKPDDIAGPDLLDRPALTCTQPQPDVTISVWPSGCVCQAVRAPGSNVTIAPANARGRAALKPRVDPHGACEIVRRSLR